MRPIIFRTASLSVGLLGANYLSAQRNVYAISAEEQQNRREKVKNFINKIKEEVVAQANLEVAVASDAVNIEIVDADVVPKTDVNSLDFLNTGYTHSNALHVAMSLSDGQDLVEELLKLGAKPSLPAHAWTAYDAHPIHLWAAAGHGNGAILNSLLAAGAEVNEPDAYGFTAIHYAVAGSALPERGHHQYEVEADLKWLYEEQEPLTTKTTLQILLENGANVNPPLSINNEPVLNLAARMGKTKHMELLLQRGAKTHNDGFDSPLAISVYYGQSKSAETLLNLGMAPDIVDEKGRTPLMLAMGNHHNRYDLALTLLEHKADPNYVTKPVDLPFLAQDHFRCGDHDNGQLGDRPLHYLARRMSGGTHIFPDAFQQKYENENHKVLALLLEHGADINAQNDQGETPLHIVVKRMNKEVQRCMTTIAEFQDQINQLSYQQLFVGYVNNAFNINLDNDCINPIKLVAYWNERLSQINRMNGNAIMAMVDAGANMNLADINGETPFALMNPAMQSMAITAREQKHGGIKPPKPRLV